MDPQLRAEFDSIVTMSATRNKIIKEMKEQLAESESRCEVLENRCATQNKRIVELEAELYKIKNTPTAPTASTATASMPAPAAPPATLLRPSGPAAVRARSRSPIPYTEDEDRQMLEFLYKEKAFHKTGGLKIFQQLIAAEKVFETRTEQSLHTRFRKAIMPNIGKYGLRPEIMAAVEEFQLAKYRAAQEPQLE